MPYPTTAALAFRNVTRNARRSAIALIAVGFGIVAMLLAAGFIDDILHGMREETIETHLGHVQITRPHYLEAGLAAPFDYLLPDNWPERQLLEKTNRVVVVSPRLTFNGLISLGDTTVSFLADGVEPDKEKNLAKQLKIVAGQNLSETEPKTVILGQGLATSLGAKLGDKVVLVANTQKGGVNAVEVTVRGTFSTVTKAYDDVALRLPLKTAQQLLRVQGTHRWVVLLDRTESTAAVVAALRQQFDSKKFDIVPWSQLADFYNKTVTLFSRQVTVMKLIIAAIIVLSISNTMMMSVMERTGDVGTAMALGNSRRDMLSLFLSEGLMLGIAGALLGVILGWAFAAVISFIGIPMPPPPGATEGFTAKIRLTPGLTSQALVLAILTTLIASVYPAWKASRMIIVDALRHNR
ncbi:MAG: ABC transporter permease [Burkholderiales bacterium]|nr:ABC transporter permease [Burkholderiales bacterium]